MLSITETRHISDQRIMNYVNGFAKRHPSTPNALSTREWDNILKYELVKRIKKSRENIVLVL